MNWKTPFIEPAPPYFIAASVPVRSPAVKRVRHCQALTSASMRLKALLTSPHPTCTVGDVTRRSCNDGGKRGSVLEDDRFDQLTRTLAGPLSRRAMVKALVSTALGAAIPLGSIAKVGAFARYCPPGTISCGLRCVRCLPGEVCGNHDTCCSPLGHTCRGGGPSRHGPCCEGVCGPQDTCCLTPGNTCDDDSDCCFGRCSDNVCQCPSCSTLSDGHCVSCQAAGQCCYNDTCSDHCGTSDCCQGTCCAAAVPDCCGDHCTNLDSDVRNCGTCGTRCAPGQICDGGSCICEGFACRKDTDCCNDYFCRGGLCTADETNLQPCTGNEQCASGNCSSGICCAAGQVSCDGSTCTDTTSDPNNCNHCGTVCTAPVNGTATCTAGTCGYTCDSDYLDCGNAVCALCCSDADCDDNNLCTTDTCVNGMCVYTPIVCKAAENPCMIVLCDSGTGQCVSTAKVCNDGNLCTIDSCDVVTGDCVFTPIVCDDNNACTTDACNPTTGLCEYEAINCDDGNPCTIDTCDPAHGCVHTPVNCDDNNACTTDYCDSVLGCVHEPVVCGECEICDPQTGCTQAQDNYVCSDGICCSGICTDNTTLFNCGTCGNVCGNGQSCQSGVST